MPGQQGRFGAFLTGRDRGYLVESGRVAEWQSGSKIDVVPPTIPIVQVQVFIYLGWLSTRRRSGGLEVPPTLPPTSRSAHRRAKCMCQRWLS